MKNYRKQTERNRKVYGEKADRMWDDGNLDDLIANIKAAGGHSEDHNTRNDEIVFPGEVIFGGLELRRPPQRFQRFLSLDGDVTEDVLID